MASRHISDLLGTELLRKCLFWASGFPAPTLIVVYLVPEPDDGVSGWTMSPVVPEPAGTGALSDAAGTLSEVVGELQPATTTSKNAPKTTSDESF